jgi:hypothetical protein
MHGPRTQLGAIEIGVAELENRRTEAVLACVLVLHDELVPFERTQQPVHCRLGEPNPVGQLRHPEPRGP